MAYTLTDKLRLAKGHVNLEELDPEGHPGFDGGKRDGERALKKLGPKLDLLQEKLFAEAYTGRSRRVLVVLQGMDTSGKGGIVTHTFGMLNPDGFRLKSFKRPTDEELEHDFLWRLDRALPDAGMVGVFDRSHYEDVLVARVHELAEAEEIERRYGAINDWEAALVDSGVAIVKCMLHISPEIQRERLLARLEDPEKQWKFKPSDVDERSHWREYRKAYEAALERCNTDKAPWYVVPSDHKWYRNWAVGQLLLETMEGMDPQWPAPDYDVEEQKSRLADG